MREQIAKRHGEQANVPRASKEGRVVGVELRSK